MTDNKDIDKVAQLGASEQNDSAVERGDSTKDRRDALRSMIAGGGAITAAVTSDKWAKPVIDSLVLPAHAQTSPDASGDATTTAAPAAATTMAPVNSAVGNFTSGMGMVNLRGPVDTSIDGSPADESISQDLLEFFMPAAHAQSGSTDCNMFMNCSVDINATFTETVADFCFTGDLNDFNSASVSTPMSGAPTMSSMSASQGGNVISIQGGTFNQGSGNWDLDVTDGSNASVVVELAPGGDGCLGGK